MNKYEDVFVDDRQKSYDEAMKKIAPHARDNEFKAVLKYAQNHDGKHILDYPSGGGYLKNFTKGKVTELDPAHGWDKGKSLSQFSKESFDLIISVAGLHHYTHLERQSLYAILCSLLKPSGSLIISEVAPDTNVAEYLNEFVHEHNTHGHDGIFLDDADTHALKNAGFAVSTHRETYDWEFESTDQRAVYAQKLFGLDKADKQTVENGLEQYFNLEGPNLPWALNVYHCVK